MQESGQQTASHFITECPLNRPPNGLHGLINVDADAATREWPATKQAPRDLTISFGFKVSYARIRKTLH